MHHVLLLLRRKADQPIRRLVATYFSAVRCQADGETGGSALHFLALGSYSGRVFLYTRMKFNFHVQTWKDVIGVNIKV